MSGWVVIGHAELASGSQATIDFTSIAQDYTDLYLVASLRTNRNDMYDDFRIQLNTTDGTSRIFYGDSSNHSTFTQPTMLNIGSAGNTTTSGIFGNASVYIANYSSTTASKILTFDGVGENGATRSYQAFSIGVWNNNSAVNAVKIQPGDGTSFSQYSSATLYGIKKGSSGGVTAS
jgi:hypothetical protein